MSRDYRQELTDRIIQALEDGTAPWQKPWAGGIAELPFNPVSGTVYRGGNVLALMDRGFVDPRWCTYRQAEERGWQVRKGERSTGIEFWKFYDDGERIDPETGEIEKVRIKRDNPIVRYANVFNASQMDNVPEYVADQPQWAPQEVAERILSASGVPIHHDQIKRAFYRPATDDIHLPPRNAFESSLNYYGIALHELGHATGHEDRLNRNLSTEFGSEDYAKEELRAELASMFMAHRLGIPFDTESHAAYVGSWIQALKNDKNEIFRAARDAEKITEYVLALANEQVQTRAPAAIPVLASDAPERPAEKTIPTSEKEKEASVVAGARVNLNVPYADKDAVKALGAKWDRNAKTWYVPPGADLTKLQQWTVMPTELATREIEDQFARALTEMGLIADSPTMDGKWHSCKVSTSSDRKALKGSYRAELGPPANGYISNHDTGESRSWFPDGIILSDAQRQQFAAQAAEVRQAREAEARVAQEGAAQRMDELWGRLPEATNDHPYLVRKGVTAEGLRLMNDVLVTPARDQSGQIRTLQFIPAEGGAKRFAKDGQKTGSFHVLGDLIGSEVVCFGEGYATCASILMGTGYPVVECFDSGNLDAVMASFAPYLEGAQKVVCGDDDVLTAQKIHVTVNKLVTSEHAGKVLGVISGVAEEELLFDGTARALRTNADCSLSLAWQVGPEGVPRVVGEVRNEVTGQRIPVLINNVGREKALAAAAAHGAIAIFPVFASMEGRPTDFNDLHAREGLSEVHRQVEEGMRREMPEAVAQKTMGSDVTVVEPTLSGRYTGTVLGNTNDHTVQDIGRMTAVAHDRRKLDVVPGEGTKAQIVYSDGRGTVTAGDQRQRERGIVR
jgi:putative DNA primase/helicase